MQADVSCCKMRWFLPFGRKQHTFVELEISRQLKSKIVFVNVNFKKGRYMSVCTEVSGYREVQLTETKLKSTASPVRKWMHEHPTVQNTAITALGVLGLKTFYDGVQSYSFYTTSIGAALFGSAYMLQKVLPIFVPPTFNSANKSFKTETCRGVSLTYNGNLPILTIPNEVKPYDAGYARGYMMAAQIKELLEKNDFAFHTLRRLPRKIPYLIEKMKKEIPAEYITEMEGLVAGYNAKRKTWKFLKGNELTLDHLIYFHLLPDVGHMDFKEADNWAQRNQEGVMGCTVVVDGDKTTGPRAIRTVDWIPMDVYGKYSLIELRETADGLRSAGQSFPLFVGFLTAMNEHGLCAAMNVARGLTDNPQGMPAVFYLRKMIETCTSLKGEKGAESFWQNNSPLGPFNLSVLDENDAAGVHFYQMEDRTHHIRWWNEGAELVTLNFRYGEKGETNPTPTNSAERKIEIENYYRNLHDQGKYEETDSSERLRGVLNGPEVNNIRTTSTAYIDPKNRIFETSFDNGYAADRPLLKIPVDTWFSRKS